MNLARQGSVVGCLIFAFLVGCGGSSSPSVDAHPPDAAVTVDAFASSCGQPGDVGNELGVGKFCATLTDCSSNGSANLCSILGDPTTFFCTKLCTAATGAADCGSNTTCTCNASNQCGCTPNACVQ
ncbi:MAG: hypothetical protein K8W52_16470 [Deltaproteobacteria bacterium]|nr:hypothetical protein [Deltaproteobacteria bacterium]